MKKISVFKKSPWDANFIYETQKRLMYYSKNEALNKEESFLCEKKKYIFQITSNASEIKISMKSWWLLAFSCWNS
jgi:hypothetical protein